MGPLTDLSEFLKTDGVYIAGVAAASFIYLSVDLFIVVKRFGSIIQTASFWMLWFCTFILNILAFEALRGAQDPTKDGKFGHAQMLALIVFSTLGTAAILQSFALKIGDKKVVDISRIVNDFRDVVLEDISRRTAALDRESMFRIADQLYEAYKDTPERLRNEFTKVTSFGGRDASEAAAELSRIDDNARALQVPSAKLLAQRIAQTDLREAKRLVWQAGLSKT